MLITHSVDIDVDASGDATVHTKQVNGRIIAIFVYFGTLAANFDLVFTGETSLTPILTCTNLTAANHFIYPRAPVVDIANSAIADSGDYIRIVQERIKCVVTDGGVSKSGSFTVIMATE